MLKLIKLHSKDQIWEYFQKIDIETESWVVSKSSEREVLSSHLLQKNGYFLDLNVQWSRTFFQMIFERTFPEFKIVSREFAEVFLKRKLQGLKIELSIDVIDEKSRLRSMTYFAPLLFDQDLDEVKLQEWLNESEERKLRLKPDLLLNRLFLSYFLESKIICEDWIVAHLQTADLTKVQLPLSKLYFDLGIDYGLLESSVLKKLSNNHEIVLFQIVHSFDSNYSHLTQSYDRFDSMENFSKESKPPAVIELRKFSSAISESRFAIGKIKQWSQSGISWNHMAIVATDIKKYQDILGWPLLAEGIPVNQNKKSNYLEFQDIRELLSDLAFFKKDIDFSLVKESLVRFCGSEKLTPFSKWEEKLNSPFFTTEQFLEKVNTCFPSFYQKHLGISHQKLIEQSGEELNVHDFIKSAEIIWERMGLGERKEKIINALFESSSPSITLNRQEWCDQVESYAKNLQVNVSGRENSGLQIMSLSQVSLFNLKNVIVIGMDESGFRSQFKESIQTEDILKLSSELGVYLEHPDLSVAGFLLEDMLSQVSGQCILSYPYKDIDSSIQNPAPQWQNRAFEQKLIEKEMDQPLPTQWQWLISNSESEWFHRRKEEFKLDFLKYDSQPEQIPQLAQFSLSELSLSPSSVQTFLDCRQKFFFQRVLKLKSLDSESFDINAREKGSWYHSIFEKVVVEEHKYIQPWIAKSISESEKVELIKTLQEDFSEVIPTGYSETMWSLLKKSYFENVLKFIEHEVELRQQFPELKNAAVEWPWQVFYNWKTFEFEKSESPNSIKISGVIDRVMLNQKTNQLWIVDYKSSLKNYSSFNDWIENKEFQLLLYNHIVQNLCTEPWAGKVENLSYWQLPDLAQKKGFAAGDSRVIEIGYSKKTLGTMEEKEKVESEFLIQFQEMIVQMREGHFFPQPVDEKNCRYCEWRLGCRAPHL